jgi:hypothetical protein
VSRPGRFLPPGKTRTHCTGGWVGPRAGLDRCIQRLKINRICPSVCNSAFTRFKKQNTHFCSFAGDLFATLNVCPLILHIPVYFSPLHAHAYIHTHTHQHTRQHSSLLVSCRFCFIAKCSFIFVSADVGNMSCARELFPVPDVKLLDAFVNQRKADISFAMSIYPSTWKNLSLTKRIFTSR